MPYKYSDHAIQVIEQAPTISSSMGHTFVGSEHLLLAMLAKEDCVGAKILASKGLDYQKARLAVSSQIGVGIPQGSRSCSFFTSNFRIILKNAASATSSMIGIITTQDILTQMARLKECGASRVLDILGVAIDKTSINQNVLEGELIPKQAAKPLPSKLCGITCDLTAIAQGRGYEVIGREEEIETAFLLLSRKQKNSPCLLGSAGVGKSAVAYAIAQRILAGKCPKSLINKRILNLDIASLLAGTKYRGDIEQRIKDIIEYCDKEENVILFIDEIHTIVGAGSTDGALDAANILKPALSNGQIQIIGATTHDEYEKFIKKDPALERRFCPVFIKEPSCSQATDVLLGIAHKYESFHNVKIDQVVLPLCVKLAQRCIPSRHFPDKAIDVLDLACAVAKSRSSQELKCEHIVAAMSKLVSVDVNEDALPSNFNAQVISQKLSALIPNQNAISQICAAVEKATFSQSESRPLCSLLLLGEKGTQKSLIAKLIAGAVYPDCEQSEHFIKIDMSRYTESHSISDLIGAPSGYVGHENGSVLINFVKKHPFCVVLLDNIECAHADVLKTILQILDSGTLQGNKDVAYMQNCIVIMTADISKKESCGANIGFSSQSQSKAEKLFSKEFLSLIDGIVEYESNEPKGV